MKRKLGLLFVVLAVVLSFSVLAIAKQDVLIVAVDREPSSMNPHGSNDAGTSFVTNLMYQGLVTFDSDMNLRPELSTRWEQIDDTRIRFYLRDDVYFHNGERFTAKDVKYTFEQTAKSAFTASTLGMIDAEATTIIDDFTVDIVLKYPFGPAINHLAHSTAAIVNQKAIEAGGANYDDNPVGTGPFVLKRWSSGDSIELTRFENYWEEKPAYKTLVLRYIPEATTRAIEVETGGVDIARAISANDALNLVDNPSVNVISSNILNTTYLSYNCSKAPFDNVKVRQAISSAINADAVVRNVTFGLGERANSVMAPSIFGYAPSSEPYGYNVERAKALLAEAGYPNGFKTTLVVNAVNASTSAEIIQNMLAQIGIEVEILAYDFNNWLDTIVNGRQDMYIGGWTTVTGDADYALRNSFHSKNKGTGGNRSYYSNPVVDTLLDQAAVEMNQDTRAELYKQVQDILAEEAVYVNLQIGQVHLAAGKHVQGLVAHPNQNIDLWTVYLK